MAAELDFQAIVDLVGDKLREVFHTGDIGIRWYDAKANSFTTYTNTNMGFGSVRRRGHRPLEGRSSGWSRRGKLSSRTTWRSRRRSEWF